MWLNTPTTAETVGSTVAQWSSSSVQFIAVSQLVLLEWVLDILILVFSRCFVFLSHPRDMQLRWIRDFRFPVGVSVCLC